MFSDYSLSYRSVVVVCRFNFAELKNKVTLKPNVFNSSNCKNFNYYHRRVCWNQRRWRCPLPWWRHNQFWSNSWRIAFLQQDNCQRLWKVKKATTNLRTHASLTNVSQNKTKN